MNEEKEEIVAPRGEVLESTGVPLKEEKAYTDDDLISMLKLEKGCYKIHDSDGPEVAPEECSRRLRELTDGRVTEADCYLATLALYSQLQREWCDKKRDELEAYKKNMEQVFELPPGTYLVGDPVYFVTDDSLWSEIACAMYKVSPSNPYSMFHHYEGERGIALVLSTILGDGVFVGSKGFDYCVDSGTLGAVSVNLCDAPVNEVFKLGTVISSQKPIKVLYTSKIISFILKDEDSLTIRIGDGEN